MHCSDFWDCYSRCYHVCNSPLFLNMNDYFFSEVCNPVRLFAQIRLQNSLECTVHKHSQKNVIIPGLKLLLLDIVQAFERGDDHHQVGDRVPKLRNVIRDLRQYKIQVYKQCFCEPFVFMILYHDLRHSKVVHSAYTTNYIPHSYFHTNQGQMWGCPNTQRAR